MFTTSIARITPILSIGAVSSSGASSICTGCADEGCRRYFSIRYFASGPPSTQDMISPSVATAMPVYGRFTNRLGARLSRVSYGRPGNSRTEL
jgi:hypothetical protein